MKRLVHRDIKPSNLMLTPQGQVKVLDLGLALLQLDQPGAREMTTEGQVNGTTLSNMAPGISVRFSLRSTSAPHIYSLGCTFYKLRSGKHPSITWKDALPCRRCWPISRSRFRRSVHVGRRFPRHCVCDGADAGQGSHRSLRTPCRSGPSVGSFTGVAICGD